MQHGNPLRALGACLGLALAAACGSGQAAETPRTGVSQATLNVSGWSLREQALAGGSTADENAQLYTVTSVAEDAEGRFYVSNFGEKRVLVFDSTGTYVRTIGRGGKGPGEFSAPRAVAIANGELVVLDLGAARISRFALATGAHLGDVSLPQNVGMPVDMRVAPDGRAAVEYRSKPAAGVQSPTLVVPVNLVSGALDMAAAVRMDTVARVQVRATEGKRKTLRTLDLPFAARPVWDLEPGGAVTYGTGAEFVVRRSAAGAVAERFRAQGQPQPVTRADQEAFFAEPARKSLRGEIRFPESKPFFTGLRVDPAGNVWLNVPAAAEGEQWEVRDPSGRRLGELRLPARARLLHVGGGTVYVLSRDELDVETLTRYALVR